MMKKITALVLALVMVLVMSSSVFADSTRTVGGSKTNDYSGTNNENATSVKGKYMIPITKSIIFFNADDGKVYEPNISFKYVVAPDTNVPAIDATTRNPDPEVTDTVSGRTPESITANVYQGPLGGVTGVTINFLATNDYIDAAKEGVEVERTDNLAVDISQFTRPGIYRYTITEQVYANAATAAAGTPTVDVTSVGMTARTTGTGDNVYSDTRYLDVYIHYTDDDNNPDTDPVLEMYGAVIFKLTSTGISSDTGNITATTTGKTTGFAPAGNDTTSYANDKTVDQYYTYNLTVEKAVDGSMADVKHEFPFYVSIENTISGAKFTYTPDGNESFTGATVASGVGTLSNTTLAIGSNSESTANGALLLKHGDKITIVGLPSNQTENKKLEATVTEYNNTWDKYTADAKYSDGDTSATARNIQLNGTGTAAATQVLDRNQFAKLETAQTLKQAMADTEQKILFTNTLTEISPTGVVLRIAPYALMLAAGIFLLLLSRKRKNNAEEA